MSELDEDTLTLFSSLSSELPTMRANIQATEIEKQKLRDQFKAANKGRR